MSLGMRALLWLLATARADDGDFTDAGDVALLSTYESGRLIDARRLAEASIAADPDSLAGHYVLGLVYQKENADLSRARAELERALEAWDSKWSSSEARPWKTHANLLNALADVSRDMDEREDQLVGFDAPDELYNPKHVAERGWPLMKLGRYDEAREWAQKGIDSEDEWQGVCGRNALCAITAEQGQREASYAACGNALELLPPSYNPVIDRSNFAGAALGSLRFDKAEETLVDATEEPVEATSNPWRALAVLRLAQGRGAEAIAAARSMQTYRSRQPAETRDLDRAELDATLALVFYAAGDGERALSTIDRALKYPDRLGMHSASAEQSLGRHTLYRLVMRRLAGRGALEEAQRQGLVPRLWAGLLARLPRWEDAVDRSAVVATLTDRRRLRHTLRSYLDGGLELPPWLAGEVIPVLGAGIVVSEVEGLRDLPDDVPLRPYQEALLAEAAWWRGDRDELRAHADAALEGLVETERLLRARLYALRADAAWRDGADAEALADYELGMQLDPGVVRRLGLALPAAVSGGGSDVADALVEALARSPSITTADRAFQIVVSGSDPVTACLVAPTGARLGCADTARPAPRRAEGAPPDAEPEPVTDDDHVREAIAAFHRTAFGLAVGDVTVDLGSLDATNIVQSAQVREALHGVLDRLE